MFNMGMTEMLALGVIALLVIGPKQLPEVARVVGRLLNEFKRATGDLTSSLHTVKSEVQSYADEAGGYMRKQKEDFEKLVLEEEQQLHFAEESLDHQSDEDHNSQNELEIIKNDEVSGEDGQGEKS